MEHILRELSFAVAADGVTPDAPQFGGVAGDDGTTRVTMTLAAELCLPAARYRVLCTDGLGDAHTSDFIPLQEDRLVCTLPAAWTAAGGLCALQAVIEGYGEDGSVQSALYTPPCEIWLIGQDGEASVRRAVGSLLADCHKAVAAAAQSEDNAAQSEQNAATDADKAEAFAQDAAVAAAAAAEDAFVCGQIAEAAAPLGDVAALMPLLGGALWGEKSGTAIGFSDLSALPHAVQLTAQPSNLIPYPYAEGSKTVNGITFTVNEDGSIAVQGTASADATLLLLDEGAKVRTEGAFCLHGVPKNAPMSLRLTCLADSGAAIVLSDEGAGAADTRARRITRLELVVPAGASADATVTPMLVRGADKVSFCRAQAVQAPSLTVAGKNLCDFVALASRYQTSYQLDITDGVVSGVSHSCTVPKLAAPESWVGQQMTFSAMLRSNGPVDTAGAAVAVYNATHGNVVGSFVSAGSEDMGRSTLTHTVRSGDRFFITNIGANSANQRIWIGQVQMEMGGQASAFAPYTEPREMEWPQDGVLQAGQLAHGATVWAQPNGVWLTALYQRDVAAAIKEATK